MLQLICESVQQYSNSKKIASVKKFQENGAANINLKLPRLSMTPYIERKRSMSTVTSIKNHNLNSNSGSKIQNVIGHNLTKSATNSINFSLNSSTL